MQKRPSQRRTHRRAAISFACLAGASLILFALSSASAEEATCPSDRTEFEANGAALAFPKGGAGRPLDILAIGSSSTEGIGASSPANAYPARLEDELAKQDGIDAEVKNAGIAGELAAKTLQRLRSALKSGWAQLVIWQVGTNDAIVGVTARPSRAASRPRAPQASRSFSSIRNSPS